MKDFILYLWQLPQNILGLLVILFTGAQDTHRGYFYTKSFRMGVSLGNYIILGGGNVSSVTILHEKGHQKQSLYLGWLYLIAVGLPSILRNIWDRIAHRNWSDNARTSWYYSGYPENWADKLGGVK